MRDSLKKEPEEKEQDDNTNRAVRVKAAIYGALDKDGNFDPKLADSLVHQVEVSTVRETSGHVL